MLDLLKDIAIKALGFLIPGAVGWFYSPAKIANDIKVRVRGEGDGVTFGGGELPGVRIWLVITNLTPFTVEIDRMYGQLCHGSVVGEFTLLRRNIVGPSKECEVLIEFALNESQIRYLQRTKGAMQTVIFFGAHVQSKIHKFDLNREIHTKNTHYLNC